MQSTGKSVSYLSRFIHTLTTWVFILFSPETKTYPLPCSKNKIVELTHFLLSSYDSLCCVICLILQKGLLSLLGLKALKHMVCLLVLNSLFSPAGINIIASADGSHEISMGHRTQAGFKPVDLGQWWRCRMWRLLWWNFSSCCAGTCAVHLNPFISRQVVPWLLGTTWGIFRQGLTELLYVLRVFGQVPPRNQFDWKLSSLGKTIGQFAKYESRFHFS